MNNIFILTIMEELPLRCLDVLSHGYGSRLDEAEGDKLIERKLAFDDESVVDKKNLWLCTVHTSKVNGAGTDAGVFIAVYGDQV
jgi:hypothetical protein